MAKTLEQLAREFLSRYIESFSDLSGERMAGCYRLPSVMTRADGSSHAFTDDEAMVSGLRRLLQDYQSQGARDWRYEQLEVHGLGRNNMLASVTWLMLDSDGQILKRWRHSYVLTNCSDTAGAHVQIVAAVFNL